MPDDDAQPTVAKARARGARLFPVAALAAICGLALHETATSLVEQGNASGSPIQNAALYPKLLAYLLIALLLAQAISDLRATRARDTGMPAASVRQRNQIIAAAVAIVLYLAALPIAGFVLATPLFVFALLFVLGDRSLITLIGLPVAVSAGCLVAFQGVFNVNLPRGVFGIAVNF